MLLTFFSRAGENYGVDDTEVGNTEVIAGYIKDYFGDKIDVFKLEPVNPYPDNYQECTEVAKREKAENARPAFQGKVDLSAHDTIFLGYPIWWGEPPMIINTFLEKYDFVGKTIIPFNTHAGYGIGNSLADMQHYCRDCQIGKALSIEGGKERDGILFVMQGDKAVETLAQVRQWLMEVSP